jgi:hypothetical protein
LPAQNPSARERRLSLEVGVRASHLAEISKQ